MRTRISALVVLAFALAGFTVMSAVATANSTRATKLKATLNVNQEIPRAHVSAAAKGNFAATLSGNKLTWTLSFGGLTGPVTATYLHFGPKGKSGTVLVALCDPCKSSPSRGTTKLSAATVKDVLAGNTYVNIHTFKNPRGEIRGQLT